MKTLSLRPLLLAALCLSTAPLLAGEATPRRWNVRVEVAMVTLPEDKALTLLPDLFDKGKIDDAYRLLMEMVQRQEATLSGVPGVVTHDGQTAVAETATDKGYATEFEIVPVTTPNAKITPAANGPAHSDVSGTKFEKRVVGTSLQVEPVVREDGERIDLSLMPQRTELDGVDAYRVAQKDQGLNTQVEQPRFFTTKDACSVTLHNGERMLLGVHKLNKPEHSLELFIVQATATAVP